MIIEIKMPDPNKAMSLEDSENIVKYAIAYACVNGGECTITALAQDGFFKTTYYMGEDGHVAHRKEPLNEPPILR